MFTEKQVEWVGSSLKDLRTFPVDVRRVVGSALYEAQQGGEHPSTKALRGFGGRAVLEVIDDFRGDTFRAIYTVRFADTIYVLHCFQKKAKRGIATPQHELEIVRLRLATAEAHYEKRKKEAGHDRNA
jgi:phage-related protein